MVEDNTRGGYAKFPGLPSDATRDGKLVLNRYSTFLTKDHDFPGAKVRSLAQSSCVHVAIIN
jgi:hypothetical protein